MSGEGPGTQTAHRVRGELPMKSLKSHATEPSAAKRRRRRRRVGTAITEQTVRPYTRAMERRPRYRLRTWARVHLPRVLGWFFPPGSEDCGRHEWFRADEQTDHCYHCTAGEREHVPKQIDPDGKLWQGLNRAARAGSSSAQQIVDRMIAEDEEARRVVPT